MPARRSGRRRQAFAKIGFLQRGIVAIIARFCRSRGRPAAEGSRSFRMPIYEYRCEACGHELEVIQKVSDAPLSDCPTCGESTLTKLVSAAGFQLKGSGWYVTDFKDSGKKKTEKSEPAADKADKSEAKADKKADAGASEKSTAGEKKASGA